MSTFTQLIQQQEAEEKKDQRIALMVTIIAFLAILMVSFFWTALLFYIPPPMDEQYEVAGSIDFGTDQLGRKDINTFEEPSETPSEEPVSKSEPEPVPEETSPPVSNTNDQVITSETNEDVEVKTNTQPVETPKPSPAPKVSEPVKEKVETPKEEPKPKTEPKKETTDNAPKQTGGSDHGDTDKAGNRGTDAPVLDPNGLYSFGDGGSGLNGRRPLKIIDPAYNVQQEAKLKFEFIIAPNGTVKYVKPPITSNLGLKKAGMEAIYKWKFDPIPDYEGDQRTSVTITFKLH